MSPHRSPRLELKYFVTMSEIDHVRRMIAPFTQVDEHAVGRPRNRYTVRSIYLDTFDLRFYHEKLAGLRVRKKLRLRTYNGYSSDARCFIEIKRKYGAAVVKERLAVPLEFALALSRDERTGNGSHSTEPQTGLPAPAHDTLQRFLYIVHSLQLRPSVLIVYDREPYVCRQDCRVRITFDYWIRSQIRPHLEDIFTDRDLRHLTDHRQVLEIKVDGCMPVWLRPVTTRLNRCNEAISKYCHGIDLWSSRTAADRAIR